MKNNMLQTRKAVIAALLGCATLVLLASLPATAATLSKGNNSNPLNTGASWLAGIVPGPADIGLWDTNVTSANTVSLGGDLSWSGLAVGAYGYYATNFYNPGGAVTITNAGLNTLTLGTAGLDLSLATQNLTITNNNLTLNGSQIWNIYNGRTVTIGGNVGGAGNITKLGNGTLNLSGTNGFNGQLMGGGGLVNLNFGSALAPASHMLNPSQPLVFDYNGATVAINGKAAATSTQSFSDVLLRAGLGVISSVPGVGGSNVVSIGAITRALGGGGINFGPLYGTNQIRTASVNDASGLLGPWACIASAAFNTANNFATNWAAVDPNGNIVNYTNWTTLTGAGPTIANNPGSNVRIDNGSTGIVSVGPGATTVNTIVAAGSTARTNDIPAGSTLRLGAKGGILRAQGAGNLTIGASAITPGILTAGGADSTPGELVLNFQNGNNNKGSSPTALNSTIADNGSGAVTVSFVGGEHVNVYSTNTYTGGTYIRAGRIQTMSAGVRFGTGPIYVSGAPLSSFIQIGIGQQQGNYALGGTLYLSGGSYTNDLYLSGSGGVDTSGGVLRNPGTIYGKITLQGDTVLPAGNYWGNMTGAGNLYWRPGGICNIYGTNDYAGDTIIMNTTLAVHNQGNVSGAPGSLPPTTVVVVGQGTGAGANYTGNGNAVLKLWGDQVIAGLTDGTFLSPTNYRTVDLGVGGTVTLTLSNNARNLAYSGTISNSSGTLNLIKDGTYTQVFSAANAYSGTTRIAGGTLVIGNASALANSILDMSGGTGGVLGFGSLTALTVGALQGTNNIVLTNASGAPATLAIGKDDYGTYNYSGVLSGSGNLIKNGNSSEYLEAGNTYSGNTTINAGTLFLAASGSVSNSAQIMVGSGAYLDVTAAGTLTLNGTAGQALGGSGTINGSVVAPSGATLSPGNPTGTLTISGNLTLSGGVTNVFDLSADPLGVSNPNDAVSVSGLTLNGLNFVRINPYLLSLGNGEYPLFKYVTLVAGDERNLQLQSINGYTMYLTNDTTTFPYMIAVVVTPSHTPTSIVWRGNGVNNNWDTTTADWFESSLVKFYNGDSVLFDDTGSNNLPVNLVGSLGPASVQVNAAKDYTFSGSGKIGGATGLTKDGTGTLTVLTDNDYLGATVVNSGTLHVGNGGTHGAIGSGSIADNGALIIDRSGSLAFTNPLAGSGSLTVQGGGTCSFTGDASGFSGPVTVGPATVSVTDFANLGSSYNLTLNRGTLQTSTTSAESPIWNITLGVGGGTISHANSLTMGDGYDYPITGNGSFTKAGSGKMTLATSNSYSGLTIVAGGTLQVDTGGTTAWIPNGVSLTGGSLVYARADSYTQKGFVSGSSAVSSITVNNLAAGNTNWLSFAAGNNSFNNIANASAAGTLVLDGPANSVNTLAGTLNSSSTATLDLKGGLWNLAGAFTPGGAELLFDGGTVVVLNAGGNGMQNFNVPSVVINSGGLVLGAGQRFSNGADNQSLALNGGVLVATNTTYGFRFANNQGGGNQANLSGYYSFTGVQTGGLVYAPGSGEQRFSIGGSGPANPGAAASWTMTGGQIVITNSDPNGGSIFLGADTALSGTTTFALGGTGRILVYSIVAAQAGANQVFNWYGGTNTAYSIQAQNLQSTNALGVFGTLYNNGGALVPGDFNSAGRTTIFGNYDITSSRALLDVDVGGATQANALMGATNVSDFVQVTASAVLGGSLRVRLINGFEPLAPADQGIVILTATNITGTFANLSGGRIGVTGYPNRSFHVNITSTNVVLDQYQTDTPQAYFTYGPASGNAPLTVNFTNLSNGAGLTNLWNFGDGSVSIAAGVVSHTYTIAPSTNTVSLTVGSGLGVSTYTRTNAVIVTALSTPPTATGVGLLPDGNISLSVTGAVGTAWSLHATNNVGAPRPWPVIQTGTISVSPFTVNDLTATNYAHRFYQFSTP